MLQTEIVTPKKLALARRHFMQMAIAGAGFFGLSRVVSAAAAPADTLPDTEGLRGGFSSKRDQDILNVALNLEYLEAEFYLRAATGQGLGGANGFDDVGSDLGNPGDVIGGAKVDFVTAQIEDLANELAQDELAHVRFLRLATGKTVARPAIDLQNSFTAAARAAGLVGPAEEFDAFANENNFLLAAFIFEDVGVTAYRGAAPLLKDRAILGYAASILAVEAYHAGAIRTLFASRSDLIANAGSVQPEVTIGEAANAISDLRDAVDGRAGVDQGILNDDGTFNITPTDANGLAFGRTPGQVISVVCGGFNAVEGGFLSEGVNGRIEG